MKPVVFFLVLFVICVIRAGYYFLQLPHIQPGSQVRIVTTVRDVYLDKQFQQYFYVSGLSVSVPAGISLDVGDRVEIVGTINKRVTKQNKEYFSLVVGTFRVLSHPGMVGRAIKNSQVYFRKKAITWLPGNEGALMVGILFGGNDGMTSYVRDLFKRVGLTHIVAASGYNVSVVAGMSMIVLLRLFDRRFSIHFGIVCILLYALIAGFGAPIVRASVMAIFVFVGQYFGRRAGGIWCLMLSLMGMIIYNPRYISDISFQLSAAATAGLVVSGYFSNQKSYWMSQVVCGVWVTLFSFPILAYQFGQIAWLSPILTLIVSLLVPLVMYIGLVALAVGMVIPVLGGMVSFIAWPLLRGITFIVELFGSLNWVVLPVRLPIVVTVGCYVLLLSFVLWRKRHL